MRRLIIVLLAISAVVVGGCRPVGRAVASMQYHNINFRVAPTTMTMTLGDGSVDLRPLMRRAEYAGKVSVGRATVEYPDGMEEQAKEIASRFDQFYPVVRREMGIEWDFDVVLKLVRAPAGARGFRYATRLPRDRRLVFPIPVTGGGPDPVWTPIIAHEMTESSLIAPKLRSQLILDDIYAGNFCMPFGTRWFRDGVSDHVEARFVGPDNVPSERMLSDLERYRSRLLSWSNCKGQPDLYGAAHALILEMKMRYGPDILPRIMREVAKEHSPDGEGLSRAFKRATGDDLRLFVRGKGSGEAISY